MVVLSCGLSIGHNQRKSQNLKGASYIEVILDICVEALLLIHNNGFSVALILKQKNRFLVSVEHRGTVTLLPIIEEFILPGY